MASGQQDAVGFLCLHRPLVSAVVAQLYILTHPARIPTACWIERGLSQHGQCASVDGGSVACCCGVNPVHSTRAAAF